MSAASPSQGMHAFHLDGRTLLFSEPRQDLHVLNEAGTLLWRLLEEGQDAATIRAALEGALGVAPPDAETLLRETLAGWAAMGLLSSGSPIGAGAAPDAAAAALASPRSRRPSSSDTPVVRWYGLLGSRFRLGFATVELAEVVHPVLAHLAEAGDPAAACVRLDVVPRRGRIALYRDGGLCGTCPGVEGVAPLVKGEIWTQAVNRRSGVFLGLHAGVVADAGGALLLPGASGSGKSTLTALLVHAGFVYYSDETALLRDGDLRVMPVPLSLCVKEGGLPALASRFPALERARLHLRADGKRVAYIPPPAASMAVPDSASQVRAVVFPRYAPGAPPRCDRLPALVALERLLAECLVVKARLDVDRVRALVEWISATPCFALQYATSVQGLRAVSEILTGEARPMEPS